MLLRTRPEAARRSAAEALAERLTPAHLAVGRTGAGAVMVVRPRALPQLLGLDSATAARSAWAVQMLGARELALGLGTLVALQGEARPESRLWLKAGLLCDAVDVLAVAGALVKGRVRKGTGGAVVAVALAAVALGARALGEDEADI